MKRLAKQQRKRLYSAPSKYLFVLVSLKLTPLLNYMIVLARMVLINGLDLQLIKCLFTKTVRPETIQNFFPLLVQKTK